MKMMKNNRVRMLVVFGLCLTTLLAFHYVSIISVASANKSNREEEIQKLIDKKIQTHVYNFSQITKLNKTEYPKLNESGLLTNESVSKWTREEVENPIKILKQNQLNKDPIELNNETLINRKVNESLPFDEKQKVQLESLNKTEIESLNRKSKRSPKWYENLHRIVHIDLKGAPPKLNYLKSFIPMLKQFGATGILIEYEDTFPYEGVLADARHGNAYTKTDIDAIKRAARESNLSVIPLVQTYGHLEWLLKVKKFAHLREAKEYPQVITPCLNESYTVLYDMLDQVIKYHQDAEYFHVGFDEVYYKLTHPSCANFAPLNFAYSFMNHLIKIASHVKRRLPNVKILFWDDMLHGMNQLFLENYKSDLNRLNIKPMMWGYMTNVESYFPLTYFEKYGEIFGSIWTATAYKGAQGELATVTNMRERMTNHVSWMQVMYDMTARSIVRFEGVALTGWSRYDHFLALCELLPQAVPSLVVGLQVIRLGIGSGGGGGELNDGVKYDIEKSLGCIDSGVRISYTDRANSEVKCKFPGHEIYEIILQYDTFLQFPKKHLEFAERYMSPINLMYNYHHKKRSDEIKHKLTPIYNSLLDFRRRFLNASEPIYWSETAIEWLNVYVEPYLDRISSLLEAIRSQTNRKDWPPRPLPVRMKPYPRSF